jgi:hypothetical protein
MLSMLNQINYKDYKPYAYEQWHKVYTRMATHTQGDVPLHIFQERRPLESQDENAIEYRINNFREVTKDEFDKAINNYLDLATSLDITIDYGTSVNKEYIENIRIANGLKSLSLKEWFFKKVGAYRQTDPNAVVAILPKHTSEKIIPSYKYKFPNFNNIINQKIEVDILLVTYNNILYIDNEDFIFYGGEYEYKAGFSEKYFYHINKNETKIIYPKQENNGYVYEELILYKNKLSNPPFSVIGGKLVSQIIDGNLYEYYVSDFSGASAWGDLALGQNSDLQIGETRFIYPRHWKIKVKCDNDINGCHLDHKTGLHVIEDNTVCQRCKGTGYVMDSTPLGTTFIDKRDLEDGKFVEPEGFITPPSDILRHAAERTAFYFEKTRQALGLLNQNMTNQSGESKSYDYLHTLSTNKYIVTDLYNIYEYLLNIIDEYRIGRGTINVIFPEDMDVRNANDILFEITEAKKNNLPNSVLVELSKKFLLKKFGKTKEKQKIVEYLSIYDKLFIYGITDVAQNQMAVITDKDKLFHNLAYQILVNQIKLNDKFIELTYDDYTTIINTELDKLLPSNQTII